MKYRTWGVVVFLIGLCVLFVALIALEPRTELLARESAYAPERCRIQS
jgi:hypothetical protein